MLAPSLRCCCLLDTWIRCLGFRLLGGEFTLQVRRAKRTVAVEVEEATGGLHVEVRL